MGKITMSALQEVTYYVSLDGNDSWSGQYPDPLKSRRDGPFRTVERARNAVRGQLAGKSKKAFRVLIRKGVHELKRTLVFTRADSGNAGIPVVYSAFPGEAPVLSGGQKISGFRKVRIGGRECWVADIPEVRNGEWNFTQLFVNGKRRLRPRLPKTGFYRFAGLPEDCSSGQPGRGPDRALFKAGDIRKWRNLHDVKIVTLQLWYDTHLKIKSVDTSKYLVRFNHSSLGSLLDGSEMSRYFVENVFEALTEPGEWYLDRAKGRLYYLPFPEERIENAEIIAPKLQALIKFTGGASGPVRDIRMEKLSFQHAEWIPPESYVGSRQAACDVPGAVIFNHAEKCALYGCSVSKISQYGVEFLEGCHKNQIVACSISDMGAGGVKIGHEWTEGVSHIISRPIPKRTHSKPSATVVSDCSIHDGSLIYMQAIGIWIGNAGGNRILHNHVHHMNYGAISCGWAWGYQPTATVGDLIEGNHVHHIAWERLLCDTGGIYTLGTRPGCILRGNHIHHIGGHGIYHDEGTSEQIAERNIVHHTTESAFFTHYGKDNLVRNNIFALPLHSPFVPAGRRENHRSTVFERNIVYWNNSPLGSDSNITWPTHCFKIQDNLFWGREGQMDFGHGSHLEDWQKVGQFEGTLIADPLFHDPEDGNFVLRSDSPARRIGYVPFQLNDSGPRVGAELPDTLEKWMSKFPLPPPWPIIRNKLELDGEESVRLTVINAGTIPASGRLRIAAGPTETALIEGKSTFSFTALEPGKSLSIVFKLKTANSPETFHIETFPEGKCMVPTLLYVSKEKTWTINRITSAQEKDTPTWLNTANSVRIEYLDRQVADFKMAISGKNLLLHGNITDRFVKKTELPWQGSCVEFFAAPVPTGSTTPITQMFLVPSEDCASLSVSYGNARGIIPMPGVKSECSQTSYGYAFWISVPLDRLQIPADANVFLVELSVGAAISPECPKHGRLAMFDAGSAFRTSQGYGRVLVCKQ